MSFDPNARRHGYTDCLALNAREPNGCGLVLLALARERCAPTRSDRSRFGRIAAHLGSALRLRRALAAGGGSEEAVLRPDGACLHAEGEARALGARERLRFAARAIDRARGRLREHDDSAALDLWQGLCAGRWSLVDRFDADGRRFVIALRNAPQSPDPRALSERERQVVGYAALGYSNKLIAYALGLSLSAIAFHLSRAMRKLGAPTRVALVEFASRLQAMGLQRTDVP